jgi:hypothetical protein
MRACTDCLSFLSGCEKNTEEWQKIKEKYPVTRTESNLNHHPMTANERKRLYSINDFCAKCKEFKQNPQMVVS